MKNLSDVQIRLNIIREWLVIALLAGAPFSFNPSISTPAFGFVSFRIGLYQTLIAIFVISMLPVLWQCRKKLIKDPIVLVCVAILGALALSSPFRSLHAPRSVLLSSSFILLLMLLLSGWAYAKELLTKEVQRTIFRAIVIVGLAVAAFSLLQFILNTLYPDALGLCANCGGHVFGFPRINGFAAEPQFYASSLIPPTLLVYGYIMRQKSGIKSLVIFGIFVFTLVLTLSRGAYVAGAVSFIVLNLILLIHKKLSWSQVMRASLVGITACLLSIATMVGAATIKHQETTPNIAAATASTVIEHVSGGILDLPYNNPKPVEPTEPPTNEFQSPGVIEASQNDRGSAASMGLKWWRKDTVSLAVGLGVGNLGSYAHNQDQQIPLSFTIYMQYIFVLVEVGIVGLASFLILGILAIIRATRLVQSATTTFGLVLGAVLVGFMVHYIFFGTYINVPYVWLYTGIGLGLASTQKVASKKNKSTS